MATPMKVYIGISRLCSNCGGGMHVIVRSKPLTEEDRELVAQGTGYCSSDRFGEVEVDGDVVELDGGES